MIVGNNTWSASRRKRHSPSSHGNDRVASSPPPLSLHQQYQQNLEQQQQQQQQQQRDQDKQRRQRVFMARQTYAADLYRDEAELEANEQAREDFVSRYKWREVAKMLPTNDDNNDYTTKVAFDDVASVGWANDVDDSKVFDKLNRTKLDDKKLLKHQNRSQSSEAHHRHYPTHTAKTQSPNDQYPDQQHQYQRPTKNLTLVDQSKTYDDDNDFASVDDDINLDDDVDLNTENSSLFNTQNTNNASYSMLSSFRLKNFNKQANKNSRPLSVLSGASSAIAAGRRSLLGGASAANTRIAIGPRGAQHLVTNSKRRRQASELVFNTLEARRRAIIAAATAESLMTAGGQSPSPTPPVGSQMQLRAPVVPAAAAGVRSVSPLVASAMGASAGGQTRATSKSPLAPVPQPDQNSCELRSSSPSPSSASASRSPSINSSSSSGTQFTQLVTSELTPRCANLENRQLFTPSRQQQQQKQPVPKPRTTKKINNSSSSTNESSGESPKIPERKSQRSHLQRFIGSSSNNSTVGPIDERGSFRRNALNRDSIRRKRLSRQQQVSQEQDQENNDKLDLSDRQATTATRSVTSNKQSREHSVEREKRTVQASADTGNKLASNDVSVSTKRERFVERRSNSASSVRELRMSAADIATKSKELDEYDEKIDDTKRRIQKMEQMLRDMKAEKAAALTRSSTSSSSPKVTSANSAAISFDSSTVPTKTRQQRQTISNSVIAEESRLSRDSQPQQPRIYLPTPQQNRRAMSVDRQATGRLSSATSRTIYEIDSKKPWDDSKIDSQLDKSLQTSTQQQNLPMFEANASDEFKKRAEHLRKIARNQIDSFQTKDKIERDNKASFSNLMERKDGYAGSKLQSKPLTTNWSSDFNTEAKAFNKEPELSRNRLTSSLSSSSTQRQQPPSTTVVTSLTGTTNSAPNNRHAPRSMVDFDNRLGDGSNSNTLWPRSNSSLGALAPEADSSRTSSETPFKVVIREQAAPAMDSAKLVVSSSLLSSSNKSEPLSKPNLLPNRKLHQRAVEIIKSASFVSDNPTALTNETNTNNQPTPTIELPVPAAFAPSLSRRPLEPPPKLPVSFASTIVRKTPVHALDNLSKAISSSPAPKPKISSIFSSTLRLKEDAQDPILERVTAKTYSPVTKANPQFNLQQSSVEPNQNADSTEDLQNATITNSTLSPQKRVHFSDKTIVRSFESLSSSLSSESVEPVASLPKALYRVTSLDETSSSEDNNENNDPMDPGNSNQSGRRSVESLDSRRNAGAAIYAVREELAIVDSSTPQLLDYPEIQSIGQSSQRPMHQVHDIPLMVQQPHIIHRLPESFQQQHSSPLIFSRNTTTTTIPAINCANDDDDDDGFDYALQLRKAAKYAPGPQRMSPQTQHSSSYNFDMKNSSSPQQQHFPPNSFKSSPLQDSGMHMSSPRMPSAQKNTYISQQGLSQGQKQLSVGLPVDSKHAAVPMRSIHNVRASYGIPLKQQQYVPSTQPITIGSYRPNMSSPRLNQQGRPMTKAEILAYQTEV